MHLHCTWEITPKFTWFRDDILYVLCINTIIQAPILHYFMVFHVTTLWEKTNSHFVCLYMLAWQTFASIWLGFGNHKALPSPNGLGQTSQTLFPYIIKLLSHRKTGLKKEGEWEEKVIIHPQSSLAPPHLLWQHSHSSFKRWPLCVFLNLTEDLTWFSHSWFISQKLKFRFISPNWVF